MSASQEPQRKKIRCTAAQKFYIINHMALNKELALGTIQSPMGQLKQNEQWRLLAEELSELGPAKTVEQWKTTWRDLRSKAKTNSAMVAKAAAENAVDVPVLSESDSMVLSVISNLKSERIDVPESGIAGHGSNNMPSSPPAPELQAPALPRLTPRPDNVSRPLPKRPKVDQIYESCQAGTLAVLNDISTNLKARNKIEKERNKIMKERNDILKLMLKQRQMQPPQQHQNGEIIYEEFLEDDD